MELKLNAAEKRVVKAALREFSAAAQSDFRAIRECHSFLRDGDDAVSVQTLAEKLGVKPVRR